MDRQLTTDNNGKFQMVIPRRTLGHSRYTLTASFAGDDYYTSASKEVTFTVREDTGVYSLNLTGTPVIENGDSDTITVTLLRDGSPFSGVVLDYEIKHGSTTISTGTTNATNTNGQATISYTGTSIGDVDIIVSMAGMSLEETYVIEDCIDYQPMVSNVHQSRWTIPSQVTSSSIFGYSSDGWKYGNASSYSTMYCNTILPSYPFCIEFTVHSKNYLAPNILIENGNGDYMGFVQYGDGMISYLQGGAGMSTGNLYYSNFSNSKIRLEITSSSLKTYVDDVLIDTRSHNFNNTNSRVRMDTGSNRWAVIKDFKIKGNRGYSLDLTGTPVISNGDSDTITATLLRNGSPVSGIVLDYEIKHGSTTISTGTTSATDVNGQATISYTGTGVGDVDIIVSIAGMSLQETYEIEDCYQYITTLPSMTQSTLGTGAYKDTFDTPIDLPSEYSIEVNFNMADQYRFVTLMVGEDISNYYYHGFGNSNKQLTAAISRNNNRASLIDDASYPNQVTDHFTISYDGTTQSIIGNSRTITVNNSEYSPSKLLGLLWGRTSTINWIKIKAL